MRRALPLACLAVFAPANAGRAQDYHRAEQFLSWNLLRSVYHDHVAPNWYPDGTRFWYRVHTRSGFQFVAVDPRSGTKAPLFDPARLAEALSRAGDRAVDPRSLPFETFEFGPGDDARAIVVAIGAGFRCELVTYTCRTRGSMASRPRLVRSPDARWDAFVAGYDVWIRPAPDAGTDSTRLTTDGPPTSATECGHLTRRPSGATGRSGRPSSGCRPT